MYYEDMPLYPRMGCDGGRDSCVRVPMFGSQRCGSGRMSPDCACRRVTIENPCRPGEVAEVLLGVDDCGNLVICVHRLCGCDRPCGSQRPCRPQRPCQEADRDPCVPWPEPRRPRRRHRPDWACCR